MICSNCGTENNPGATYCKRCGNLLNTNIGGGPEKEYVPPKPSSNPLKIVLIVVLSVTLVSGLVAAGFLIIPKMLNKDTSGVVSYNGEKESPTYNQILESETTQPETTQSETTAYNPILETEPESTQAYQETQREEKYQIFTGNYNWEEAQARCEEMGGYLVQINDYDEWTYLTETFIPSQSGENTKFLIGGRRDASSKDYYWVKNGEKVGDILNSSSSWINENDLWFYSSKQHQPSFYDDETKEGEYYLQMFYIKDTSSNREKGRKIGWSINDISLSEEMSFICEFD